MFNIFEHFHKLGLDPKNTSIIDFESPISNSEPNFCGIGSGIIGHPPIALIDNNESTAWANEVEDSQNMWVLIHFVYAPVYIKTLMFHSLCSPPRVLLIEGSNDKTKWETLTVHDTQIPDNSSTPIRCYRRKLYSYIRLNQTKAPAKQMRLHIHKIEIYGTIGDLEQCTHIYRFKIQITPLIFFFCLQKQ